MAFSRVVSALAVAAALVVATTTLSFVLPVAGKAAPALRAGAAASQEGSFMGSAGLLGVAACTAAVAAAVSRRPSKTAARYTTQVILPSLAWLKSGVKAKDLAPTQLKSVQIGGQDVLLGKDESGKIFCVANLCPHIGTPMSEGADVIGDVIICPLHGSSFKVTTGELIDWCPSPPIIGPLTGFVIEKKNLLVFDVREGGLFGGGELEVLIDVNAKRAYEANYWKGLLDAQGKDDGTYY